MDDSLADSLSEVEYRVSVGPPQLHTRPDQERCPCMYKGEQCIYVKGHSALHATGRSGYWER